MILQRKINKSFIAFCAFALTIATTAFATTKQTPPPAQPQLAQYSSDNASCEQKSNLDVICTYSGSAKFDQGETHLHAPQIVVYKNTLNQVYQIFAFGDADNRAYYDSVFNPEDTGPTAKPNTNSKGNANSQNTKPINAVANIIKIFPLKNLVTLTGKAHVVQDKDTIDGSYIEYDLNKQTVISTPKNNEHTTIILNTK